MDFFSPSRIDTLSDAVLIGLLSVVATLGLVHGGLWAGASFVAVTLLVLLTWLRDGHFPWPDKTIGYAALAFPAGAACLAPFLPFYDEALHSALKLGSIFVPLSFLSSPALRSRGARLGFLRNELTGVLIFGFIVLSLTCVFVSASFGFDSRQMTKLNRGLSYGLFAAVPLLALCAQNSRRKETWLLVGAALSALVLTHSRTTQIASLIGLGAFFLIRRWPENGPRVLSVCFGLSFAWPFTIAFLFHFCGETIGQLPRTLLARVEIWDYMAYRILERPALGWGLGASGKVPWALPHGASYVFTDQPAAHPHNALVQLWVETGLWGLLGWLALGIWVFRAIKTLNANVRPYAYGGLAFTGVLLMAAYDLWTDSLWAAMALGAYLFGTVFSVPENEKSAP